MLTTNWPVPIAMHLCPSASEINPVLSRVFQAMRAAALLEKDLADTAVPKKFYASDDKLLHRVDLPEFTQLIQFFADAIQKTVGAANAGIWPQGKMSLQLEIMGCWFQIQNGMAFHDVYTHGNYSWSGVYYVQIDEAKKRMDHPEIGKVNGGTRFYGPYSQWQGGSHMDIGNSYLQKNSLDIHLEEGKLVYLLPIFRIWPCLMRVRKIESLFLLMYKYIQHRVIKYLALILNKSLNTQNYVLWKI